MTTGRHAVSTIAFVAIVMTSIVFNVAAEDVPAVLPDPNGKPADMSKPVKVYILAGQSNMVGMGDVRTFDYIGEDPATAPMLKEMRGADGKPRVCEKVWISSAITKRDESGNRGSTARRSAS